MSETTKRYPASQWDYASVDPTAGVRLAPRLAICPRCGVVKGRASHCRPGLCRDCVDSMTRDERLAWAA